MGKMKETEKMKYEVDYELDGKTKRDTFWGCKDAGMAFAKCQKANPGATMLHCTAISGTGNLIGKMEHVPPPVQRDPLKDVSRPPVKGRRKDGIMPFYDEVLSRKH